MNGDSEAIRHLNAVLKNELTAISQYFLHARMFRDWGYKSLGDYEYGESVDEMKHADRLVERILFLGGLPNLQDLGKLRIGQDALECLRSDLKLEMDGLPVLRDGIAHCERAGDYVSRGLLEDILAEEEEHVDWLETQLALAERMGTENWLQSQV